MVKEQERLASMNESFDSIKVKSLYLNGLYLGIVFECRGKFIGNGIDLWGGVSEVYLKELDGKIKFL
jgi:hypothetical protein